MDLTVRQVYCDVRMRFDVEVAAQSQSLLPGMLLTATVVSYRWRSVTTLAAIGGAILLFNCQHLVAYASFACVSRGNLLAFEQEEVLSPQVCNTIARG